MEDFMKLGAVLGFGMMMTVKVWSAQAYVFVSFSMPEQLMSETLSECARLHIPAVLNGLIANSMPATVKKIHALSQLVPKLNLQIDPTAFERFGIKQVPALVVEKEGKFDVLYGNLNLKEGLVRIATQGDSGFSVAEVRRLIGE
jgi:conjugal transfer pilus assembly protein TrbC